MRKLINLTIALSLLGVGLLGMVCTAVADEAYPTERLELKPVNEAPLRSGFVVNIHPDGPINYAHEIYQLNGAAPLTSYQVKLLAYLGNTSCIGEPELTLPTAVLDTNKSGNGQAEFLLAPEGVEGLHGLVIGVKWQVWNDLTLDYQTRCTVVTLD